MRSDWEDECTVLGEHWDPFWGFDFDQPDVDEEPLEFDWPYEE